MIDNVCSLKLLFSARDPAAAHAVVNLARQACSDSRFSVRVMTSSPASELLEELPCECIALSQDVSNNQKLLNLVVRQELGRFHPDAIIAGASGPDAGVDEVLVKQAEGIPTYVIQDFWGDVNLTLGVPPDCYFVVDQFAAKLTQQRVDSETFVVGSVKHASYNMLNVSSLRTFRRAALGVEDDELVIGYFGMPLGQLKGYWRTLEALAQSIQDWPITLIYRPHPKEEKSEQSRTCDIFGSIEKFDKDQNSCAEETFAACDLILSCYSSCGIDSELLGRSLDQDNRLSIFLLYDAEVMEYYKRYTQLDDLPISLQNRAVTIKDRSVLKETMNNFSSVESRLDFLNSKFRLLSAAGSVNRVLNKVFKDYILSESNQGNLDLVGEKLNGE